MVSVKSKHDWNNHIFYKKNYLENTSLKTHNGMTPGVLV